MIRVCSQRAKPDLVGLDALRADCPALATAIEDLGLTAHLPQDWKEQVTASDLADWSALADRYDESAPPAPLPDYSRLRTIAETLKPPPELPNWWERFKTWLAAWIDSESMQWPGWLRWPDRLRPGKGVLYGLMIIVLIAAAVVIAMELRAAGVLGAGRRRRTRPMRPATVTSASARRWDEFAEIDQPIEQLRPEHLLRVLVAALTRSHRLERDRDLTCRELITAARFDTAEQRAIFANVALRAEQTLYADPQRVPTLNDPELGQSAQGLYGELLAANAGRPSK
jgi:hypothetical protein